MIDFAALVLGPAMSVFGQPITVTPIASRPGAAAYQARGVYALKPVDVPLDNGTVLSTQQRTLGIRLVDFPAAPMQLDQIEMAQGTFIVADIKLDGQGGADLWLRSIDEAED